MKENVILYKDPEEVVYGPERFSLLGRLREEAVGLMRKLPIQSFIYGSVARGDVHPGSDIDVIIPRQVDPLMIELGLGAEISSHAGREIVQATPNHVIKAHIHLNHYTTVTFPLVGMTPQEEDFYRFSGICTSEDVENERRVPGVNKKLLMVEPTEKGHIEYSITERKKDVSRMLGVGMDIIDERIRVLSRRTRSGRTGVFLSEELKPDESFASRLRYLADRNYMVRKQLKQRGDRC